MSIGRLWRDLRRSASAALLAASLAGATPAQAQTPEPPPARHTVPGADAPAFARALALWLDDDEATALPALAALAHEGNTAARLLLGLIDRSPTLQGPWLARLPRAQRLEVMRAPGGMSGRSWLAEIASDPIAAAWLALMRTDAGLATGAALAALGETRAAREALVVLAMRHHPDLGQDWHDWMDPELAFLIWPRAREAVRTQLERVLPAGHPHWLLVGQATAAWDIWLASSPAAAPFAAFCRAECPQSVAACQRAAHAALGSHVAALTLGSPVEALIAQTDFLASPRSRSSLLRRILLSVDARGRRARNDRATQTEACLGSRLAAEADRYRHIRNGQSGSDG